jgi:hypothetical protein
VNEVSQTQAAVEARYNNYDRNRSRSFFSGSPSVPGGRQGCVVQQYATVYVQQCAACCTTAMVALLLYLDWMLMALLAMPRPGGG